MGTGIRIGLLVIVATGYTHRHRRSQRGVPWVLVQPTGARKTIFGKAEFMGISCKCTPEGKSAVPSPGRDEPYFLLSGGECGV